MSLFFAGSGKYGGAGFGFVLFSGDFLFYILRLGLANPVRFVIIKMLVS